MRSFLAQPPYVMIRGDYELCGYCYDPGDRYYYCSTYKGDIEDKSQNPKCESVRVFQDYCGQYVV